MRAVSVNASLRYAPYHTWYANGGKHTACGKEMREGNSLPICRVEEGSQSITNSHVSPLKSLNQGKREVCAISLHPKVVQTRLVFVDAGLSNAKPHMSR